MVEELQKANSFYVDENYQAALKHYNNALAEIFLKRSLCNTKLNNFEDALNDANQSLALDPKNPKAYLRKGICSFEREDYQTAYESFESASSLDPENSTYSSWARKCEAELKAKGKEPQPIKPLSSTTTTTTTTSTSTSTTTEPSLSSTSSSSSKSNNNNNNNNNNNSNDNKTKHIPFVPPPTTIHSTPQIIATPSSASQIRHEWYQNNTHVFVSIFCKGVKKEDLNIDFNDESLSVNIKLISGKEYILDLELCDSVEVPQCSYEILSTKIEIKLKKTRQVKWDTLESTVPKEEKDKEKDKEGAKKPNVRPWDAPKETTSKDPMKKNWEKIVTESANGESLDDRDPQAKFWQDLFADASEEERRAIMKSYTESGGTVLNMNWGEVKKEKTPIYPPEGMEPRKYSE